MTVLLEAGRLALPGRLQETELRLETGTLSCLVGPNGSGKTSLLHALAGIGSPGGDVRVDGLKPHKLRPAGRQRLVSYLPASRDAAWPLSAQDLIALGLPSPDPDRVAELLELFELDALAERRVDRLSTGERSRVLIARALAARPRLLLLDEPASNLDPLWQLKLMDHLRRDLDSTGAAALVAVHDLELARAFSDRLIVMHAGRIAADGQPDEILGSAVIPRVFGIERADGRWRAA